MSDAPIRLRFDARTHPVAAERVAAWRDAFSLTVDTLFAPDEIEPFSGSMTFRRLGAAMLVDARYTAHALVRDRATIARTGHAHVLLDVFPEGGFEGVVGGRATRVGPGDCFMMDLRGTLRLRLDAGRFVGLVMPRALFEARMPGRAALHGLVFPAASPRARLLGPVLTGLADGADSLPDTLAAALGPAVAGLIAACVSGGSTGDLGGGSASGSAGGSAGGSAEAPASRRRPDASIARVRRHIERHAHAAELGPDALGRHFGLSRSALYRLFRSEGGVAEVIRRRRAGLAVRALAERDGPRRSLEDIARASGFPDARALRRTLRAVHGLSPAQIRRQPPPEAAASAHGRAIGALLDSLETPE